jgi:hypothetical protein
MVELHVVIGAAMKNIILSVDRQGKTALTLHAACLFAQLTLQL